MIQILTGKTFYHRLSFYQLPSTETEIMIKSSSVLRLILLLLVTLPAIPQQASNGAANEVVRVDLSAASTPFPHFWEEMFGSGRANLALRDSYRRDLDWVRGITGFKYVRFHAIFQDENGVYDEDAQGNQIYNFSYVDQIYDGLLAHGIKPFVEISFMPKN